MSSYAERKCCARCTGRHWEGDLLPRTQAANLTFMAYFSDCSCCPPPDLCSADWTTTKHHTTIGLGRVVSDRGDSLRAQGSHPSWGWHVATMC